MPMQMSSEKFMRAERRNRLEIHHLNVKYKMYDRETVRLNYEIDREKRNITKAFKAVTKTSGASDLGIPPKNENDNAHEKCLSYTQGLKLSNKRLLEWRECEKQLHKFIMAHEQEMIKHTQVRPRKKKQETVRHVSETVYDDDDDVFFETASNGVELKLSPVDILKEDPENDKEVFDIKKWQREIIDSYKDSICKSVKVSEDDLKAKNKLRSKSTPNIISNNNNDMFPKKVRPHTAHAPPTRRPTSGRHRPSSANALKPDSEPAFLITKDSVYMKSGDKFQKFIDCRPVEKHVMVNNYIDTLSLPQSNTKQASSSSGNSLCPVEEGDENEDIDAVNIANAVEEIDDSNDGETSTSEISPATLAFQNAVHKAYEMRKNKKLLRNRTQSTSSLFKHSNSDISSLVGASKRHRRDSGSSVLSRTLSYNGSVVSSHRPSISLGIPEDIEEFSRGQDKLASEISAERPLATNKLVSISKVVKAAMTFSKVARKRALQKMQEENSSDGHEIIRQERLRRLQSRQSLLDSIASQWQPTSDAVINQVK